MLRDAASGQDIDENDWLRLADSIIEYLPDELPVIEEQLRRLTASWSLPRRREIEVRIARFDARARHAKGDLSGAIERCADARHSLEPCASGGDDFIEFHLPWLIEAKRFDDAGRLAFEYAYELDEYHDTVPEVVLQRLGDEADQSVWWPLCIMRATSTAETLEPFVKHAAPLVSCSRAVAQISTVKRALR